MKIIGPKWLKGNGDLKILLSYHLIGLKLSLGDIDLGGQVAF